MKLLMTTDTIGGVWTYTVDLIRALSHRGVNVHLVTLGRCPSPAQRRTLAEMPALTVTETDYRLEWMDEPWRDVDATRAMLHRIAEAERPDVVHLNQFCVGANQRHTPTLIVGHSCVTTWMRWVRGSDGDQSWERYRQRVCDGIQHADAFVAPTDAMLNEFMHFYGAHRWSQAIHNGRDASHLTPASKRPFVLAAGRVWDEAKNLSLLDAIAPRLRWPTLIAGAVGGPGGQNAQPRHARALGLLEPTRLARYMGWASIYALPARYEPFGLSAVEAALSGAALVLGDIPTLREVWGGAAVYIDPNDPDALARAINRFIHRPAERVRYARTAQRRAQRYTAARMADRYLTLYGRLCEGHPVTTMSAKESV